MARKKTQAQPAPSVIIEDLGNGYVRLKASEGARLVSGRLGRPVSEAVVKPEDAAGFYAE